MLICRPWHEAFQWILHQSGTKTGVIIGPDGKVKTTNIVGGHPVLIDATLATLKEWRYEPEKSQTTLTLIFDFHP